MQPGRYVMRTQMPAIDALRLLINPGESRVRAQFTIPEGLRLTRQVDALAKNTKIKKSAYQAALKKPQSLGLPAYAKNRPEGFLFPDTYELTADATATSTLKQMVDQYKAVTNDIGLNAAAKKLEPQPVRGPDRRQHHRARGQPGPVPRQGRPGALQPARPGHAARAGLHGHLRGEPEHQHDDAEGPREQVEVQHLPAQGPAARPDLRARARRRCRRRPTRSRASGSTSRPSTSTPARPSSPRPTPSSSRSWRSSRRGARATPAAVTAEPAAPLPGDPSVDAPLRGARLADRALAVARRCTRPRTPSSGLTGWSYGRAEVGGDGLAAFVAGLDATWRGLSLTMPLKVAVLELAASRTSPTPPG